MKKDRIIVGSRGSRLALAQAEAAVAALRRAWPEEGFEIRKIVTGGDRNRRAPVDRMSDIGVFTRELEEALLNETIGLAVHSLKDMPTVIPEGLFLAGVLERSDPRDALVSRCGRLAELPPGARIGTGSPRRQVQLLRRRPDLEVRGIRGNVDTRLRKVQSGEADGIIVAAAAMLRLGWQDRITECLPAEDFIPAVGQGAIAFETRRGDSHLEELVSKVNDVATWRCVRAERAFLKTLGGGCRAPIAALATGEGDILHFNGMAASTDGSRVLYVSGDGPLSDYEELGTDMARRLLAQGAAEFLEGAIVN